VPHGPDNWGEEAEQQMAQLRGARTLRRFAVAGSILGASAALAVLFTGTREPASAAPPASARPAAPPKNGEMGFVVTAFAPSIYPGMKDNCPNGYSNTISENYVARLSEPERARLTKPENEKELAELWKASAHGPNNTNLCTNFDLFPEQPLQKPVQGQRAFGLDLDGNDGKGDSSLCEHASFEGPNGEKGIDNQSYRAMGCVKGWRAPDGSAGDLITYFQNQLKTGEFTIVIQLHGVDSLVNDNDVQVVLSSSEEGPIIDAQQNFVAGASYNTHSNPRWRNVLRGRIVNGVLTTASREIVIKQPIYDGERGPRMVRFEWVFTKGRLQMSFRPDGSLSGVLGGYLPLFSLFQRGASSGRGSTDTVNYDCASSYNTLKKLADGGRDPKTGQCTTISTSYDVSAIPAYVSDAPRTTTASTK
jgi:hypothetical protein